MGFTAAERQQVWLKYCGKYFEHKCAISWCNNKMNVFQFHVGHNTPKANGGSNNLHNLIPICPNCNQSMGKKYTIDEWDTLHKAKKPSCFCFSVS
uniref:HNH domain-containing protein n=1 Tax=viral metagenome TaxID=1070528 RepID=A0A6C0FBI7_9ZZZZ|tara:strand:- start:687 stop:971 length:285 start_codon:yes stop_codon:yes gene_type:complete